MKKVTVWRVVAIAVISIAIVGVIADRYVEAIPDRRAEIVVDASPADAPGLDATGNPLAEIAMAVGEVAQDAASSEELALRRFGGACGSASSTVQLVDFGVRNGPAIRKAAASLRPAGKPTLYAGIQQAIRDFEKPFSQRAIRSDRVVVIASHAIDGCRGRDPVTEKAIRKQLTDAHLQYELRLVGYRQSPDQQTALKSEADAVGAPSPVFVITPPELVKTLKGLVLDKPSAAASSPSPALPELPTPAPVSELPTPTPTPDSLPSPEAPTSTPSSSITIASPTAVPPTPVPVPTAPAQSPPTGFTDGFEGSTLNPFWTVVQQFGSVSLSTSQAHSGAQSVQFSSADGGQRNMQLRHGLPSPAKGSVSIYYYDVAPGQETLYEQLQLTNSSQPRFSAGIGTMDFDAYCYMAGVVDSAGVGHGQNAKCGIYPQLTTTSVLRTAGWHLLTITVTMGSISFAINGATIFTVPGDYGFDTIVVNVSGPYWRPDTKAYFDDFKLVY